jgi:uncharacterized SAM-binding protein YcdF (DUF218 family)
MTVPTTPGAIGIAGPRRRVTLLRATLTLVALLIGLAAAAWSGRETLLRAAADAWIVSDPAGPVDAVAVFGGGIEYRPFAAAAYYQQGLVRKVLISNIGSSSAEQLGVLQSHVEANRQVLLKLGVPETAIEPFGDRLSNTYEEARALREWADRTGARSIIVPTEVFTTRRLRWVLGRAFDDRVTIRVTAIEPHEYRRDNWWKDEHGLIAFQNEIAKYLYYRFKY